MIITKQRNLEQILQNLGPGPVFLVGCSECATLCHTGGTDEILAIKEILEKRNVAVSGYSVLDPACHLQNNKRMFKEHAKELANTEKILVFACGNGIQTVAELFADKEVLAGTDTLFLGQISHVNEFNRRCSICGECLVDLFGGLCPLTLCPKSMLNGPCGGSTNGKCEVSPQLDCVWDRIYDILKKRGTLQDLSVIQPPKDWSKSLEMSRRI
jgi:hypothetical protein